MGWYDYIANQSGVEISIKCDWNVGNFTDKLQPGENKSYGNRQANCLYYFTLNGDTISIQAGDNRCQNWEFLIGPGPKVLEMNGFAGRPPGKIEQQYPPTGSASAGAFAGSPESLVDYAKQREMGSSLAAAGGATKTRALIEGGDACFKDILTSAVDEAGIEKVVAVLANGPAEWSHHALQHLTLSDEQRAQLTAKASENGA